MTTRSSDTARDFELGTINEFPLIASDIIYEGSAVGLNSSGYARPLVAGDPFVGFAESNADNSAAGSAAGDVNVRVRTSGIVKLSITSAALTDFGKKVFASDDDTFTYTATANSEIGSVYRYVSSGVVEVKFDAFALKYGVDIAPLAGKFHQGIGTASDSQVYPLGTIMRKPDGREYAYGKAGGTIGGNLGAHNHDLQHVGHVAVNTNAALGDTTIKITIGSGDGQNADGAIALNEMAGGYIHVFVDGSGADGKCFTRGIVSHTATTGTGSMTIVVDDPIPVALVAATAYAECIGSPYRNLQQTNATGKAVVGVPTCYATVGQYLWLQTKGACWVSPQAALGVTVALEAVFRHDGSFDAHEYGDAYATTAQHAGYVLASLAAGAQGAPFVKLNI
jgi:hypothetical protein